MTLRALTVEASCGSFEITLDVARAPKTTSSFAYLARRGVYNDTLFHRIVPGFVVQGGDPSAAARAGPDIQSMSNHRITSPTRTASPRWPRARRSRRGRSGSQFFVVSEPDAGLTPDYALLGHVTSALDAVQRIEQLGTPSGRPRAQVAIRRITIRGG